MSYYTGFTSTPTNVPCDGRRYPRPKLSGAIIPCCCAARVFGDAAILFARRCAKINSKTAPSGRLLITTAYYADLWPRARVSIEESLLPRASAVHNNKSTALEPRLIDWHSRHLPGSSRPEFRLELPDDGSSGFIRSDRQIIKLHRISMMVV